MPRVIRGVLEWWVRYPLSIPVALLTRAAQILNGALELLHPPFAAVPPLNVPVVIIIIIPVIPGMTVVIPVVPGTVPRVRERARIIHMRIRPDLMFRD